MFDLATASAEIFKAHLDELFHITDNDQPYGFQLIEVTPHDPNKDFDRIPFSLLFSGPADVAFEQGTFPFTHPKLGDVHIFMVPIGERDGVMLYESVFS